MSEAAKMNPLVSIAALSVTVASLVGVGVMTGLIGPSKGGDKAPPAVTAVAEKPATPVAAEKPVAAAPEPAVAPTPVLKAEPAPAPAPKKVAEAAPRVPTPAPAPRETAFGQTVR